MNGGRSAEQTEIDRKERAWIGWTDQQKRYRRTGGTWETTATTTTTAPPVAKPAALRTNYRGGASESKSESGPSVKPRFFSSPRNENDGEYRKSDRNRDSDDGDGNPLGAVGKVTAHVLGGGGPFSVTTPPPRPG